MNSGFYLCVSGTGNFSFYGINEKQINAEMNDRQMTG